MNTPEGVLLTPLQIAIEIGHIPTIEGLILGGANVNAPLLGECSMSNRCHYWKSNLINLFGIFFVCLFLLVLIIWIMYCYLKKKTEFRRFTYPKGVHSYRYFEKGYIPVQTHRRVPFMNMYEQVAKSLVCALAGGSSCMSVRLLCM